MIVQKNDAPQMNSGKGTIQRLLWYVVYTYPRHEKSVAEQLKLRDVEPFLPTYTHTSTWKDRKVKLESPLFPGYVFARILASERVSVLSVPSVIRILSHRGELVPVNDEEIAALRICVKAGSSVQPHCFLDVGDRVRVREGAFEGLEGFVVRHNNGCKVVVGISLIHQSVALEIDYKSLELLPRASAIPGSRTSSYTGSGSEYSA